jgi:hypothetical protein
MREEFRLANIQKKALFRFHKLSIKLQDSLFNHFRVLGITDSGLPRKLQPSSYPSTPYGQPQYCSQYILQRQGSDNRSQVLPPTPPKHEVQWEDGPGLLH